MSAPDAEQALASLRAILKPGDTLYGIQRHRSRSGKSLSLSLVFPVAGGLKDLDGAAACVLRAPLDRKHGGIRTEECGRDLTAALALALFADAGALTFRRI